MFEFRLKQARVFKTLVDAIVDLVGQAAVIDFTKRGMSV